MSEPTNADRASWAFEAVSVFGQATGGANWQENLGMETAIYDLLCDLMHLVDREKCGPWSRLMESAEMHYNAEVEEEADERAEAAAEEAAADSAASEAEEPPSGGPT